jgi:AcrR family transcriptional regulator
VDNAQRLLRRDMAAGGRAQQRRGYRHLAQAEHGASSTYHYFPGGKQQLATEAVRWAGDTVAHMLQRRLKDGPVEGLRAFLALWRETIITSHFHAGCPVLAVSVEEPTGGETEVLDAAANAFGTWETLLAQSLRRHGAIRRQAAQLATLIVVAVEGTVAMCRAKRSAQPLDDVARNSRPSSTTRSSTEPGT